MTNLRFLDIQITQHNLVLCGRPSKTCSVANVNCDVVRTLTGCRKESPERVREHLTVDGPFVFERQQL